MKIWENKTGNTVIEFEKNQHEILRFAHILGQGAYQRRKENRKLYDKDDIHIRASISALMTKIMLDTYLVGTNYTQEFGTEKEPKSYHIKDFIARAIKNADKWNIDGWNGAEIEIMKKYDWEDII